MGAAVFQTPTFPPIDPRTGVPPDWPPSRVEQAPTPPLVDYPPSQVVPPPAPTSDDFPPSQVTPPPDPAPVDPRDPGT